MTQPVTSLNPLVVAAAAFAGLVATTVWNAGIFAAALQRLQAPPHAAVQDDRPSAWKLAVEYLRNLVVAAVLGFLIATVPADDALRAVGLGFVVWLGFPAMILTGAVLWQNEPPRLVAIHAGDWLVKLLLMAALLGVWP
jgi:hypothetical protein